MGQVNTDFVTTALAVTRDNYVRLLQDNVFDQNATLKLIREKSKVVIRDGGNQLQIPLLVSGNTTVDSFTYYDQVDTAAQKGMIDAKVAKAYYSVSLTISDQELEENSEDSKVVDLLDGKMMQAEESLFERLNDDLYLDGTGNGGKNLTGFLSMIPSQTASSTYLGVDGTKVTKWTHIEKEGAIGNLLTLLDSTFYALTDGSDKPDVMITDRLGLEKYEAANRSTSGVSVTYPGAGVADSGFASAAYKGIPVILDVAHPQQSTTLPIYHMLNSKYLGFYFKSNGFRPPVVPPDQLAQVSLMSVAAQLVTNNRRRQGKLRITS